MHAARRRHQAAQDHRICDCAKMISPSRGEYPKPPCCSHFTSPQTMVAKTTAREKRWTKFWYTRWDLEIVAQLKFSPVFPKICSQGAIFEVAQLKRFPKLAKFCVQGGIFEVSQIKFSSVFASLCSQGRIFEVAQLKFSHRIAKLCTQGAGWPWDAWCRRGEQLHPDTCKDNILWAQQAVGVRLTALF